MVEFSAKRSNEKNSSSSGILIGVVPLLILVSATSLRS